MPENKNRCWPGYELVAGKKQHEQGSCRPKAKSKMSSGEKTFRKKRKTQLDRWQESHPHRRRSAAQHLSAPKKKSASHSTKRKAA